MLHIYYVDFKPPSDECDDRRRLWSENYVDMLHEERTAKAIRNTLIISVS